MFLSGTRTIYSKPCQALEDPGSGLDTEAEAVQWGTHLGGPKLMEFPYHRISEYVDAPINDQRPYAFPGDVIGALERNSFSIL